MKNAAGYYSVPILPSTTDELEKTRATVVLPVTISIFYVTVKINKCFSRASTTEPLLTIPDERLMNTHRRVTKSSIMFVNHLFLCILTVRF